MSTIDKLRAALECPEATSDNESDYAFERGACRENARLAPIHAALIALVNDVAGLEEAETALAALDKALEET